MEAALENIKALEILYKQGYGSDFLDRTINKIISYEISESREQLEVLKRDLVEFEEKYSLSSEEFIERFRKGVLGDDADFVEWNALYKMYRKLQYRLNILEGKNEESKGIS